MKRITCLLIFIFFEFGSLAQGFLLPGDGNWYQVAKVGGIGRHAYLEYYYSNPTAYHPSSAKGEITFVNYKNYLIQKHQTMGYINWNQPQFALVVLGNFAEIWVKATNGNESGNFEIIQSKYANFSTMGTSDANLSDNGGTLTVYDKLADNAHVMTGDLVVETGNIGIGVAKPTEKLVVDGKIHSEEVKVEIINGSDFVFESDYHLRSLEETESYIQQHKHLPDIPSAKEMEEDGLELGAFNMKLLQKIEELTLYQIELLKRLERLEQKQTEEGTSELE